MEIDTSPRPLAPTRWGLLALSVVLLAPVSIFVLLPLGLGLEHHVVTGDPTGDAAGGLARGTVALERMVPVSDLQVGDVITYLRPAGVDGDVTVTRRIVAIGPDGILTEGADRGPWLLRPDGPTLPRVVFSVPWIGWAYVAFPRGWWGAGVALALVVLIVLAVLAALRVRRRMRRLRPAAGAVGRTAGEVDAAVPNGLNSE